MLNSKASFYFLFSCFISISCSSAVDEIVIDTSTRYPFIEFVVNPDSIISGNFSYSLPLVSNISTDSLYRNPKPVKVVIYKDGLFLDSLIRFGDFNNHYKSKHHFRAQLESNYSIKLEYPDDFYSITKQIVIPQSSTILSSRIQFDIETLNLQRNGTKQVFFKHQVAFEISDPGNESNYYTLSLKRIWNWGNSTPNSGLEFAGYYSINLPNDPVFTYYENEGTGAIEEFYRLYPYHDVIAFSDQTFNGQKFELLIEFVTSMSYQTLVNNQNDIIEFPDLIYIQQIDYDYYQFIRTINLAFNKQKQPFREPTQIWSNIDGAIGIISGLRTLKTIGLTSKGIDWVNNKK